MRWFQFSQPTGLLWSRSLQAISTDVLRRDSPNLQTDRDELLSDGESSESVSVTGERRLATACLGTGIPSEDQPDARIPEDEDAAIALVREDMDEDMTEKQKNLAIAKAKLIGDL